jgi:hypothetical protein
VCQAAKPGLCRGECPCAGTIATRVILRDRCFYTFTFGRAPAFVPYGDIDAKTCIVVYEHDEPANVQHHEYTKTSVRIETCSHRMYSTYFSRSSTPLYFCVAFKRPARAEIYNKNVCTWHAKHCKARHRRCAVGSSAALVCFEDISNELQAGCKLWYLCVCVL